MKIAVVGAGYVGLVTAAAFADLGNDVTSIDNDLEKIKLLKKGKCHFFEPGLEEMVQKNLSEGRLKFTDHIASGARDAEIVFIAVGTPPKNGGEADLSQMEAVAKSVARGIKKYKLIIEKSTVPVRTGERLRQTIKDHAPKRAKFDVASNPEFLREGSALYDFMHPDRIVIGTHSSKARALLRDLYKGIDGPLFFTDINSAEIIKHASNSFLAMKISFINAISRLCELAGADVEEVASGIGLDKRIERHFLNAGIGFGGFCFPKDLSAFIRISEKLGYDFELLKAVQNINDDQRRHYIRKIESHLGRIKGKRIAVWGLAFKPNTDDMRYAPSIDVIQHLAAEGGDIIAYDPKAVKKARKALPAIRYGKDPFAVCRNADCLLILTEWSDFRHIDLKRVKRLLRHPLVIDGRNLYDIKQMAKLGFHYVSMGRKAVGER